jgi:hypothetical protein
MIVNGKILKVTPAVYDMVSYRQTFLRSQYFWVDAVCINQEDINERGQQVRLMRDIYKQASRVVVWFGPLAKAEDANLAREMVHFLASQHYVPSVSPGNIRKPITIDSPGWGAVGQIFAHRWFSRVWVIQEVAVATTVQVMYRRTCTA